MRVSNPVIRPLYDFYSPGIRYLYTKFPLLKHLTNTLYLSNRATLKAHFEEFERMLGELDTIKNAHVIELGPGNSLYNSFRFLARGANSISLVDAYPRFIESEKQRELIRGDLAAVVKDTNIDSFKVDIPDGALFPLNISLFNSELSEMKSHASYDFIFSTSVLEHVLDVKELIRQTGMVLRSGGYAYHYIDLRDHYNFESPFLFYEYSEDDWRKKYTRLGVSYTNRIRYPEYMDYFKESGFNVVKKKLIRADLSKNIALDKKFQKFSADELSISKLSILLRKK